MHTEAVKAPVEPEAKASAVEKPSELAGHWVHDCVIALINHGITRGYPYKTSGPNRR